MKTFYFRQSCYASISSINTQRGMTLIIALIFLLILTMLGVTAMQSTVVEERIAGNTRDKDTAFQSAEAGLRAGEAYLLANACTPGIAFTAAPGAGLINNVNGTAGTVQYGSASY